MSDPVPTARPARGHPAARVLAVLVLLAAACGPGGDDPAGAATGRTVLLVSLDTLRPERLGAYGGADGVSPHVDALAAEGVVFDQGLAPAPWTLPSHMTMLTGLDPIAHGVHNGGVPLSRHVHTLAEHLAEAGFETAAFTDGGFVSREVDGRRTYMEQGFDVFDDERAQDAPNGMRRVAPPACEWLEDLDPRDDAFLFVHTFDAHSPYDNPDAAVLERFRARGAPDGERDHAFAWLRYLQQQVKVGLTDYWRMSQLMNDYDAGVHQADLGVGRLLDALRATGRYDDALVIVTSDHGEAFFEHDLHVGHGLGHRDNELRVPLVLKLPAGEGAATRHDELVGLVDLARTVLEAVGVEAEPEVQGESLLGLVRGEPRRHDWLLGWCNNSTNGWVVQGRYRYVTPTAIKPLTVAMKHLGPANPPDLDPADDTGEAYEYGSVELVYDVAHDPLGLLDVLPGTEELYDRVADPGERHDLSAERPDVLARMRGFYAARKTASERLRGSLRDHELESESGTRAAENLDRLMDRQGATLEELGYVEGNVDTSPVAAGKRRWISHPHEAPDTTALVATDRRVHDVRARLLDGQGAPSDARAVLQAAGEAYVDWALGHPDFAARAEWRLRELETLATLCGVELDTSAWR